MDVPLYDVRITIPWIIAGLSQCLKKHLGAKMEGRWVMREGGVSVVDLNNRWGV